MFWRHMTSFLSVMVLQVFGKDGNTLLNQKNMPVNTQLLFLRNVLKSFYVDSL